MKRIVFLIIASLLVLGLVLPGCGPAEEAFDQYITLGIAGPMGAAQGDHHYYGAELAANEINADGAGGVDVGGTIYGIKLIKIDTNEILNPSGADGTTRMEANIDKVDFFLGGFRTEAVLAYRSVALEAGKLFINCGAATEALQQGCAVNYTNYKYWFKGTPPNELFLSMSNSKLLYQLIVAGQTALANPAWMPKIALVPENALWTELSRVAAWAKLGPGGANILVPSTGSPNPLNPDDWMWLPSPVATTSEMNIVTQEIGAADPDIIFTIMSGPCGASFGNLIKDYADEDVIIMGINVEAQRDEFPDAAKYAEGMIFLDSWSPGVNYTDKTAAFLSDFEDEYGEGPIYTAATYDAVLALVEAIEGKDSTNVADIIAWMEDPDNAREGTTGVSGYYQQWDEATEGAHPLAALGYGPTAPALTKAQVLELYPWLANAKFFDGVGVNNWTYDKDDWTMPAHTTHDLVYGTQWVTGTASQWQDDGSGNLVKVGVWPVVFNPLLPTDLMTAIGAINLGAINATTLAGLQAIGIWDHYGWWNFEYPGTDEMDLEDWKTWLDTRY